MSILDEIFATKHIEVAAARKQRPLVEMRRLAEAAMPALPFATALRRPAPQAPLRLIAEIKCASPSRGLLSAHFDPIQLATLYQQNGAAAISVLTDETYFKGSLLYLQQIAALQLGLPLLRKDFIDDPYQIYEGRAAGADAILLIAAYLAPAQLADLQTLAAELGMAALVEVHNLTELEQALAVSPLLVGINNRDLRDFKVDLNTCLQLRASIPPGVTVVAESGIHTAADVSRLALAGIDAMLVGEALVTAADTALKIRSLLL
jgi:indole-3-glycerol phosphate synthase